MATASPRILVVDDEQPVQQLLDRTLRSEGYDVVPALDGEQALTEISKQPFDLVMLDVMLPKLDSFEVCRRVRAHSSVPIIMLTAKAEEVADRVLGLELGADDYIIKTCSMRELRSRVKAVLRRARMSGAEQSIDEPLLHDGLRIDPAKRTVERGGHAALVVDRLESLPPGAARRVFGAARSLEEGGSLTVVAATGVSWEPQRWATTRVSLEAPGDDGQPKLSATGSATLRAELLG